MKMKRHAFFVAQSDGMGIFRAEGYQFKAKGTKLNAYVANEEGQYTLRIVSQKTGRILQEIELPAKPEDEEALVWNTLTGICEGLWEEGIKTPMFDETADPRRYGLAKDAFRLYKKAYLLYQEAKQEKTPKAVYYYQITLGDWSMDGHGQVEKVNFRMNYPVSKIRAAYKESCRKAGLQFNHNQNYMDPGAGHVYSQVWTDYDDNAIRPDETARLRELGILSDEFIRKNQIHIGNDGCASMFSMEAAAILIMRFIAYSMPEDFWFEHTGINCGDSINGFWNRELDVQFGYGLFNA